MSRRSSTDRLHPLIVLARRRAEATRILPANDYGFIAWELDADGWAPRKRCASREEAEDYLVGRLSPTP